MPDVHASSRLRGHLASHGIAEGTDHCGSAGVALAVARHAGLRAARALCPSPFAVLELFTRRHIFRACGVQRRSCRFGGPDGSGTGGRYWRFYHAGCRSQRSSCMGGSSPCSTPFHRSAGPFWQSSGSGPSNGTIVFIMIMILTPFCLVNVSEGLKEIDAETH